jgi:hypothetical protein
MHRRHSSVFRTIAIALLAAASAAAVVACGGSDDPSPGASGEEDSELVPGVSVVEVTERDHVVGATYDHTPPFGGDHNQAWMNCGVYLQQVPDENAVHSLEHGAVWITYADDLAADQVATLEALAAGQTHVLVSPYAGLQRPIVLTAWGVQKGYDSADDPGIAEFIVAFQQGPQTPEPGAPCVGGIGTPQ